MNCVACADFILWLNHFERTQANTVIAVATAITALATIFNVYVSFYIGRASQALFESTNRPVIAIKNWRPILEEREPGDVGVFSFSLELGNVGTYLAWDLRIDESWQVGSNRPVLWREERITIAPGQWYVHKPTPDIRRTSSSQTIRYVTKVSYRGAVRMRTYSLTAVHRLDNNRIEIDSMDLD